MGKRIHELAKEWGIAPKDLIAKLDDLGITGKRSQSSLSDHEVERLATALGRVPQPAVTVGSERVVGERLVTERAADREVTTRERIVESRVGVNVIRRRAKRVEVVREREVTSRPPDLLDDGSLIDLPDLPDASLEAPARGEAPEAPAAREAVAARERGADIGILDLPEIEERPAPAAREVEVSAPAVEPEPAPVAAEKPAPEPAPVAEPIAARPAAREVEREEPKVAPVAATARPAPAREAERPQRRAEAEAPAPEAPAAVTAERSRVFRPGTSRMPASAPSLDDGMRRVQVLGKIDLKKPPAPPPSRARPASPGAAPAPGAVGAPPMPGEATDDGGRRKKGKRVVRKPGQTDPYGSDRMRGPRKPMKKRAAPGKELKRTEITTPSARKRHVRISDAISVGDLAKAMGLKAGEIIKKLMDMGVMATMNHVLDYDHAAIVASEFEYTLENVAFDVEKELEGPEGEESKGEPQPRDPVVTIMGHVDHGKTSLLDALRSTDVAGGEAGGITQHIGAYTVKAGDRRIAFIDTPGHEAFTAMRARGAKVTDIVVLVVAANDGVMPQTVEAINHARAAKVPLIVAVNKMDLPEADLDKAKRALADHGLASEDWGGDTIVVPVSAKTKQGLDQLLEMIGLQADVMELKANADMRARGTIIEAKLDRGRGPVATVLVQEGTLRAGDPFVVGTVYGRVRAMLDWQGNRLNEAGPSTPAEILGLSGVPEAGEALAVVADEATARQVADHRQGKQRQSDLAKSSKVSLDDLYQQLEKSQVKELRIVLKVDVQGSIDALREAFSRLSTDEVQVSIIHASVGGVTESDVLLASASNGVIVGFNVRPEPKAAQLAEHEGVDIRLYTIIYDAINQIRESLEGMLEPTVRERTVGRAEVRQVFGISGIGQIAGSSVSDGKILRGAQARLLRDHAVIHEGKIGSLKRFKEDVREVAAGYECGIGLEGFNDVKPGDVIEVYELEKVARRIASTGAPRGGAHVADRAASA
jgi:translation initiation factor IF-2